MSIHLKSHLHRVALESVARGDWAASVAALAGTAESASSGAVLEACIRHAPPGVVAALAARRKAAGIAAPPSPSTWGVRRAVAMGRFEGSDWATQLSALVALDAARAPEFRFAQQGAATGA